MVVFSNTGTLKNVWSNHAFVFICHFKYISWCAYVMLTERKQRKMPYFILLIFIPQGTCFRSKLSLLVLTKKINCHETYFSFRRILWEILLGKSCRMRFSGFHFGAQKKARENGITPTKFRSSSIFTSVFEFLTLLSLWPIKLDIS